MSVFAHRRRRLPAPLMVASVLSFKDVRQTSFPSSHLGGEAARQHFLELLMQQIQDSEVFEGPDGCRNLALDSRGADPERHLSLVLFHL